MELVVAMTTNGIIGKASGLPWHIPEDLKRFRKLTEGSVVVMGRKTYNSLPYGPLKNRINLVLSREPGRESQYDNLIFVTMENIFHVLDQYQQENKKIFIVGGSEIYKLFWDHCTTIHITHVLDDTIEGDTFFPHDMQSTLSSCVVDYESDVKESGNTKYKFVTLKKVCKYSIRMVCH
jgi:dihydrofolate reductase